MLKRSPLDDSDNGVDPAGRSVLVVNQDADACELVARLVELAGFPAVRSYDPTSVVDQLAEGGIEAVLIDSLGTGIAPAFEILSAVRSAEAKVKDVAVLILAATDTNRLYAFQSGVDAYVVRPFHADELIDAVRSTLARSLDERAEFRTTQLLGSAPAS